MNEKINDTKFETSQLEFLFENTIFRRQNIKPFHNIRKPYFSSSEGIENRENHFTS